MSKAPAGTRAARTLNAPRPPETETDERDQVDVLSGLLDQFSGGNGYSVKVERLRDVGMRQELAGYLGPLQLTADLFDDVLEAWGGGRFRGRVYQGSSYETSITFQIAGEPRARHSSTFTGEPPAQSPLEKLVAQLAEGQTQLIEAIRHQPAQGSSLDQALAIVKAMREVATAPAPPAQDPLQLFSLFDKMLELRQRVAQDTEGGGPDNGIAAILRDGITPLVNLVRQKMEMDAQREQRAARTLPAGSSSPPSDLVLSLASRIPEMGRAFLASAARAGKAPELYAEVILDQLSDADYAALPALLSGHDFVDRLLAAVPQWKPFPEWFAELSSQMHASIERAAAEEAPEIHDGPAPSVNGDRPMHGDSQMEPVRA